MAARARLQEERKTWRRDHPHGFVAKPQTLPDGSQNIMTWDCVIPGKANTIWEGGRIKLTMKFSEDYPSKPPECHFGLMPDGSRKPLFHPNVYPSGKICLNIINPDPAQSAWRPAITIKQVLLAIQELLDNPFPAGARPEVQGMWEKNRPAYDKRIKEEAAKYRATSDVIEIE